MEDITKYVWFQEGPGVRKEQYTSNGVKLLNVANLVDGKVDLSTSDRFISKEEANGRYKHFLVDEGDLIIASSGIQVSYFDKKMGFIQKNQLPLCMNTSTIRFKSLDKNVTNIRYFMYFLKSELFKRQLQKQITGSAQLNFGPSHLKKMKINMPSIEKQKKIVEKLDKIQNIIDLRNKQLNMLKEVVKSQFVEMFQSGIYPKEELGKLCDVRDGTHDSPKYLEESEYKFITSKNIVNNEIDFSEAKYITKQDYDKFNTRSKVNYGDILMPMIGTIGKPIIVNIPDEKIDFAIKNVALIKFLENSKVTNIYIKNLFDSDYFENAISQNKRGGTQKFIALSDIRKLEIEIPPIELQNKFADFVKQVDKQKFEIKESLTEMENLYNSLMNEYFG